MTVSTSRALIDYKKALAQWLKHDGLNGGGGAYDRKEHKYSLALEPDPKTFGLEGFALKAAEQVRAREVRLNP